MGTKRNLRLLAVPIEDAISPGHRAGRPPKRVRREVSGE